MIDPLVLINNEMASMLMSSQQVFDYWKDNTAMHMKSNCIDQIQGTHQSFSNEMNNWMRIYMHAEKIISEQAERLNQL